MIFAYYSGAFLLYTLYAWLNYADIKDRWWYIPLGLAVTAIGNLFWMFITKLPASQESLLMRGVVWDAILSVSFVLTPFLFFGLRLSPLGVAGLIVSVIGLGILKLSLL